MTQAYARAAIAVSMNLMTAAFALLLLTWPENSEPASVFYVLALLVGVVLLRRGS